MFEFLTGPRVGPIGVDLGSRSVKLIQMSADRTRIVEAARWDLPFDGTTARGAWAGKLTEALRHARESRRFRGRDAVLCLGQRELFVQNVRVPKSADKDIELAVRQEAESRIPFPSAETELRYLEAADVRQGDTVRREVIVLACHRPVLDQTLQAIEDAGLRPRAVEIEANALLRCYDSQYRRDEDRNQRIILVHIGNASTAVLIAQGTEVLFLKYIDVGGKLFDEAVSRHLHMPLAEAWALRRHNGDRRADQQDPEVARSVAESLRPVVDRLVNEISMCVRYHNVTFRGQPLKRLILAGGEATPALVERFGATLDVRCELGEPLRTFEPTTVTGRKSQWDVALGLALRTLE
jgi:type IV pilus assembly protein PilM